MQTKLFTLKFSSVTESFPDENLRAFIRDREVTGIREHFFIRDEVPYWAVMVNYNGNAPGALEEKRMPRAKADDYRNLLDDTCMPLFNGLRDWRTEKARKEGVPPYVVMTNRQLALIASKRPESLNRLSAIEGVGKVKIEKHGKEILCIVASAGPLPKTDDDAHGNSSPGKA